MTAAPDVEPSRVTSETPSMSATPPGVEGPLQRLFDAIEERRDRLVRLRRRLHATPEASNDERQTTTLVAEALREHGYDPRIMADDVGVVADLVLDEGSDSFIAFRAELDAVAIHDDKQAPYASTHAGLCHACGHDVHTTTGLGVAAVLADHRDEFVRPGFRHNLRFVFQPAEETSTGARSMINQGVLDGVEAIIALHVDPFIEVGRVGLRNGPLTSACKSFQVTIRGRSGHSARPYEAVDPIPAATTLVDLFYQLAPRSIDSRYPLALTVASIQAGNSFNAIPDEATLAGTLRAARLVDLESVQRRMDAVVSGTGQATGCDIELEFKHSCPATDNDPRLVQAIAVSADEALGAGSAEWLDVPSLGGEDFAYYQELIPGAIVRIGAALEDARARRPLHSSLFDVDERAIVAGGKLILASLLRLAACFSEKRA
jgi:amidohydrolase